MKKNTIKAFTLVEMLIVIVIIGILIAALMPRMQSAQGRARDVARKNDLSQIQTAIVTSQQDKGNWPGMDNSDSEKLPTNGISVRDVESALLVAGMSAVPGDPLKSSKVTGIGEEKTDIADGQYGYIVVTKNGTENGGFVLMAKTEIEGGSNWIYCDDSTTKITSKTDIASDVKICTTLKKDTEKETCENNEGTCTYYKDDQLRYIITY